MPRPAGNALRVFSERGTLLVKVTTADGAVGWGETWAYPKAAGALIRTSLASAILGADATAPRKAQAAMLERLTPDRRGQTHMAISALDIALWDAFGRIAGTPIAALLGGALRERVFTYASGPLMPAGADRYEGLAEAVASYAERGFRGVKIRIGAGAKADEAAIRTARDALGPDARLMVDMNEGSTLKDAIRLVEAVKDAGLSWVEEPVPHEDLPAYRRLAERLDLPLAGGESFYGAQGFRDTLAAGALDIVQPDIALCGGITETMRIAGLADAFNVPVAPHVWGGAVAFLAALQVAAVLTPRRAELPHPMFEFDVSDNPVRSILFDPEIDGHGTIAVPDGPGLGIPIEIDRLADLVTDHWVLD